MLGGLGLGLLVDLLLSTNSDQTTVAATDFSVEPNVGSIRGVAATDGNYTKFTGIPYAQVDANNPFGNSTAYPAFNSTFDAIHESTICPQLFSYNNTILGDIDCLQLNVYVPNTASADNLLPVMVFIHGGLFAQDSSANFIYGPQYLVQHDVILVTINYRLGPYGFMCVDLPGVTGNQGLKDQLLAFKWIKENIKAFGGDAAKITVFGESAGGQSIDLHLISPHELLFNQVILESGTSLSRTLLFESDKSAPQKLAQYLGLETTNATEALEYLKLQNSSAVIDAGIQLNLTFKPCVETTFDGFDEFLNYTWVDAKEPKIKKVSVLIGFNENEQAFVHTTASNYSENLDLVSQYLNQTFDFDDSTFEEMKSLVANFYFGDEMTKDVNSTMEAIRFDSDYTFIHPVWRSIGKYLDGGVEKIFYYMFSYVGGANRVPNFSSHADELRYLFNMTQVAKPHIAEDTLIINRMTTMWTNFAKYGDPTPNITDLLPVKWLPLTNDTAYYLRIDTDLTLNSRPFHHRMAFWDAFYQLNVENQKFIGVD